jgi:nucleoside-diphosphate-sugar epimerase
MQTVLGAGSAISTELAKELHVAGKRIRLVSRNPKQVNGGDELMAADLSDAELLDKAVQDSEVVYVTIAFEYKTSVWKEKWPVFTKNLIQSCVRHKTKVVFLDNMYAYDTKFLSHMTEETPVNPSSEKGKVRKQIFDMLQSAADSGKIECVIARAADFYGPGVEKSAMMQSVFGNLRAGKSPQWIGNLNALHSFSYSKDVGKGLAILGSAPDAYNRVWHLPTYAGKLTQREWIELVMKEMNARMKIKALSEGMLGVLGIFVPILREIKDVYYQFENDYHFDSSKFNTRFSFTPTIPEQGIREIIAC